MSDLNFQKAYASLKAETDFLCEQQVESPNPWSCRYCQYFYDDHNNVPQCLKKNVKDWCLYHIDREEK